VSIDDPESLREMGDAAILSARLGSFAEIIGVRPRHQRGKPATTPIEALMEGFAHEGIGRVAARNQRSTDTLTQRVRSMIESIELSPLPSHEWQPMRAVLGDDLLSRLTGASASSLQRYNAGDRATPDPVAHRLHCVALIVADLHGSYNDYGVRRWFERARTQLDGAAPIELLNGPWTPDDEPVKRVRALAAALLGSPAT
jgi:hypothetical protein